MPLILNNIILYSPTQALCDPINITIHSGEIVALMGKSGCGKSTLLSAIAGHLSPDFHLQGQVTLNSQSLLNCPAHTRQVGMLFQDDLLFPQLNIWQNIAFGLDAKVKGKQRKQKAMAVLEELDLLEHSEKRPDQLSGGQRARISLMRTLLANPKALLLDEPFSKLDPELRKTFRHFVFQHIHEAQIPTLMVTHDPLDIPDASIQLDWPNATSPSMEASHA